MKLRQTVMKFLLLIPHSIYLQYVLWFGGKIDGGVWYSLWELQCNAKADIELTNAHIICVPYRAVGIRVRNCKLNKSIRIDGGQ
jgi:hypothetical protein